MVPVNPGADILVEDLRRGAEHPPRTRACARPRLGPIFSRGQIHAQEIAGIAGTGGGVAQRQRSWSWGREAGSGSGSLDITRIGAGRGENGEARPGCWGRVPVRVRGRLRGLDVEGIPFKVRSSRPESRAE